MLTEQRIRKLRNNLIEISKNLHCTCIFCQPDIRQLETMVATLNMVILGDDKFEENAASMAAKARAGEKVAFQMGVV